MLSSYRLGDLVLLSLYEEEVKELLVQHPNSIGSKYILEKIKNTNKNKIDIITEIVLKFIEENKNCFPENIEDSTLIHLRLGDVVAGNIFHEESKRPIEIDELKSLVVNDNNNKYVIGKCFFCKASSTNYEECIELSQKYLDSVIHELGATHFNSGNADIDLCCAVKSKLFIQGRGFYSRLIVEIRNKLNLKSIETQIHTPF